MAKNLFISYDLYTPGKDYSKVYEAIQSLGAWARVNKSVWYVKSNVSCEHAAKHIWSAMDANDSLIVVDASTNEAYWYNLAPEVSQQLMEQWHK